MLKIDDAEKVEGNGGGTATENRAAMEKNWARLGDKLSRETMPNGSRVVSYGYQSLGLPNNRRILHHLCFEKEGAMHELVDIIQDQPDPGKSGLARWSASTSGGNSGNGILLDLQALLKECAQTEDEEAKLKILEKALVDQGELVKHSGDPEYFIFSEMLDKLDSFCGKIEIIGELHVPRINQRGPMQA